MIYRKIADWDDAYANMAHIPDGAAWPARWLAAAAAFRDSGAAMAPARRYGPHSRHLIDMFLPAARPRGLLVFVHGGYWRAFDPQHWSHLARGPLAHGLAVAMPGYRLCPEVRIADIVADIAAAIAAAAGDVDGPIVLAGHSAGGHLVTRMMCEESPLAPGVANRVVHTLSISGVHDLRPLMAIDLNGTLRLDAAEADAESPALLRPRKNTRLTCWAGAAERAEFLRQNALLANIWTGLGAATAVVEEADRHHFNVVEGLADPDHPMTRAVADLTGA